MISESSSELNAILAMVRHERMSALVVSATLTQEFVTYVGGKVIYVGDRSRYTRWRASAQMNPLGGRSSLDSLHTRACNPPYASLLVKVYYIPFLFWSTNRIQKRTLRSVLLLRQIHPKAIWQKTCKTWGVGPMKGGRVGKYKPRPFLGA